MAPNKRFQRYSRDTRPKQRVLNSYLIVTEGLETEKNYFNAFKTYSTVEVKVVPAGAETVRVVEQAIKEKRQRAKVAKKNSELSAYDGVWVLFDKDDNPKERYLRALRVAKANDI